MAIKKKKLHLCVICKQPIVNKYLQAKFCHACSEKNNEERKRIQNANDRLKRRLAREQREMNGKKKTRN